MKRLVPAFAIALAATTLFHGTAQAARPDTRAMTCGTAQATIRQYNSVVMTTGPHTYVRIVSGHGYCAFDEEARLTTAPTLDNPRCRVGFVCRSRTVVGR